MKPHGGPTESVFNVNLKPVIAEIARTQVCFPDIQLLVDKIVIQTLPNPETPTGAFRLQLTDGENVIHALAKRRHYKRILIGDIREGSYILVKEYFLGTAKRIGGDGEVIYFVLEDFYAIGEDEREKPEVPDFETIMTGPVVVKQPKPESQITEATEERSFSDAPAVSPPKRKRLVDERPISRSSAAAPTSDFGRPDVETPSPPSPKRCRLIDERPTSRSSAVAPIGGFGRPDNTEILRPKAKARPPSSSPSSQTRAEKRKLEIALGEIDSNFGSPPKKKPSLPAAQGRKPSSVLHKEVSSSQERSLPRQKEQKQHKSLKYNKKVPTKVSAAGPSYSGPGIGAQHAQSAPAPLIPIKRPLNIVPLSKLRGCRRNQVHDVFVVIESVGDEVVKPARMPSKRDLRVVDPSTEKKVLLCIFVDPERFKPAAGTIALIRSVTTHEWEGGMINIYPQQCNGKQWFIPNPIGVQGCDVEGMRRWWAEKQAAEVK